MRYNRIAFSISLLLLMSLYSCIVTKHPKVDGELLSVIKLPQIDSNTEVFDTSVFQERPSVKTIMGDRTIIKYFRSDEYEEEYENDGSELFYYHFFKGLDPKIVGDDYSVNPIFSLHKEFNDKGIIQVKGIQCWYGFKLGIWYYYDSAGKLINSINEDAGYKFRVEDVFNYCEKKSIRLQKNRKIIDGSAPTHIAKYKSANGKPIWIISYQEGVVIKTLWLNAKNGRLLKTIESPMPVE